MRSLRVCVHYDAQIDPFSLVCALSAGLIWGCADFGAGLLSRRLPAVSVTFWSQFAAGFVLLAAAVSLNVPFSGPGFAIGLLAGVCGGLALTSFYRGLAVGAMSIVTPIASCGVLVPVAVSIVRGDTIGPITALGMVVTGAGILLVSLHHEDTQHPQASRSEVLRLGFTSAAGFGAFLVLIDLAASQPHSSALLAMLGSRTASLVAIFTLAKVTTHSLAAPRGALLAGVVAAGLLDTLANGLYVVAAGGGNLGLSSMLASTYPAVTVLLAWLVLRERLARVHQLGVLVIMIGVLTISGTG